MTLTRTAVTMGKDDGTAKAAPSAASRPLRRQAQLFTHKAAAYG
jgi:hypothetical protein